MKLGLRDAAQKDLAEIWLETARNWNVEQAEDYLRAIEHRLLRICEFPQSYPEYASRVGAFRKAPSGEHLIFYLVGDDFVDVVRILHNRMDIETQLA